MLLKARSSLCVLRRGASIAAPHVRRIVNIKNIKGVCRAGSGSVLPEEVSGLILTKRSAPSGETQGFAVTLGGTVMPNARNVVGSGVLTPFSRTTTLNPPA